MFGGEIMDREYSIPAELYNQVEVHAANAGVSVDQFTSVATYLWMLDHGFLPNSKGH